MKHNFWHDFACVVLLLQGLSLHKASAESKPSLHVEVGEPVVVAQAREAGHPWGIWQFPTITGLHDDLLEVSFSRTVDSASLDSAKKRYPPLAFTSADNGQTWRPASGDRHDDLHAARNACRLRDGTLIRLEKSPEVDVPRKDLPEGFPFEHGYNGIYTIRDPQMMPPGRGQHYLARKSRNEDKWSRTPVVIDDPDGGIICYDPPNADYAVVRWRICEQILEMPDCSLLGIAYGARLGPDRKPWPKWQSYCLKSTDGGKNWRFHSVIARDDQHPLAGYTEPRVAMLPDGSLLTVLRTECARTGAMYRTRSTDGGKTWDKPRKLWPFGVLPQLLTLDNGVTVLSFGRPGVHVLFSKDGAAAEWENPVHLVVESFEGTGISGEGFGYQKGENPKGRPKQTRTSGYTSLVPMGPNSFIIAYDQFNYPNDNGKPRKTILVRQFTVELR